MAAKTDLTYWEKDGTGRSQKSGKELEHVTEGDKDNPFVSGLTLSFRFLSGVLNSRHLCSPDTHTVN